jgi:hypothetical protein
VTRPKQPPPASASRDAQRLREFGDARRRADVPVIEIVTGERLSLSSKCRTCKKPVMAFVSLCFSCATGRPRLIVRKEERKK